MNADEPAVLQALREAIGPGAVSTRADDVTARSRDRSGEPPGGAALAVVRPADARAVAAALRIARDHATPVVPQGHLTGLAGAAGAVEGALLLDLSGLDRIIEIDPVSRLAVVEPGVTVSDLAAAAAAQGLFYAPDPASADIATIGGTIATNAGGMRCIKYGVTRDAVRSLQLALTDGSLFDTRAVTRKSVAGLDVTSLIVGSEGTLAVVTRATLALLPAPGPTLGVAAIFADAADAIAAAREIAGGPRVPATLELLDGPAVAAIHALRPDLGLPAVAGAWVLAVTDAVDGAAGDLDGFESAFARHGATSLQRADSVGDLEILLDARRALHPALRALRGESINGDIAVPLPRLDDAAQLIAAAARALGVTVSIGGHVGDGNLHPVVVYDPADDAEARRAHAAMARFGQIAQQLGGTATGEHGIGVAKLDVLDGEMPPRLRALQRALKAAFDPDGILNPGRKI